MRQRYATAFVEGPDGARGVVGTVGRVADAAGQMIRIGHLRAQVALIDAIRLPGAGAVERCLLGQGAAELPEWWAALEQGGEPFVTNHCPGERSAAPLWLHADEAQYVQHGEKKRLHTEFLFLGTRKAFLVGDRPGPSDGDQQPGE